jgi:hypothetical protein
MPLVPVAFNFSQPLTDSSVDILDKSDVRFLDRLENQEHKNVKCCSFLFRYYTFYNLYLYHFYMAHAKLFA